MSEINFQKFFCLVFKLFCIYEEVEVCKISGLLPSPNCKEKEKREFIKWRKPSQACNKCVPEYVPVEVCADSTKRPNNYCPVKVVILFEKGAEPAETDICQLHKPPEPQIEKCKFPYHKVGKIVGWSGTFMSGLVLTNLEDKKFKTYYNETAKTTNAERYLAWYEENDPPWKGQDLKPFIKKNGKWDLTEPNEQYYAQISRRLEMMAERELTAIISLIDFSGSTNLRNWPSNPFNGLNNINGTEVVPSRLLADPASRNAFLMFIQEFVNRTKKFHPFIIYEIGNEPGGDNVHLYNWYRRCIQKLLDLNVPKPYIQIYWWDSSNFTMLIRDEFPGILSSIHGECSEHSINDICQGEFLRLLMPNGCYPSSDGADWNGEAKGMQGVYWKGDYRRPSEEQIRYILSKTLRNGGKGFEHLSGSCCLYDELPNLDDAINLGRPERGALCLSWILA